MYRTPAKQSTSSLNETMILAGPEAASEKSPIHIPSVRRSIGEWETGKLDQSRASLTPTWKTVGEPAGPNATSRNLAVGVVISPPRLSGSKTTDKVAEAKALLVKAKMHINSSRNLKTDIKNAVLQAVERLYQLVKESNSTKSVGALRQPAKQSREEKQTQPKVQVQEVATGGDSKSSDLESLLGKHLTLLEESCVKMEALKEALDKNTDLDSAETHAKTQNNVETLLSEVRELRQASEKRSYASAVATSPRPKNLPQQTSLHSVIVGAKDELETGEEVLERIRQAVNAKEGGVAVERVRKAKDAKVIVACRTEEERQNLKAKLSKAKELTVEEIKNKDPLVILRDVLQYNTDDEILRALRNQNKTLFDGLAKEDQRCEVAYKKRTRNPHTSHMVMRVSPKLWQAMVATETVHVDLQRIKVKDQSPLVQCSLCLGYGHGRRFCKDSIEKCSHCGGPHLKAKCADWLVNSPPSCCNCVHAKLDKTEHNAFSEECTIRKKWEALARASVAYC